MITTIFEKLFERMGYALTYTGIASVVLLFLGLEQVSGTVKAVIKAFHIHTGAYSVESLAVITAVLVPLNLISLGITLAIAAQYRYLHGLYEKQPENLAKLALMTMVVVVVCAVMATTLAYLAMVGIVCLAHRPKPDVRASDRSVQSGCPDGTAGEGQRPLEGNGPRLLTPTE